MSQTNYRAAIIGLGFIGGADQVSGDALGQEVQDLDGTHYEALDQHPRVDLVGGSSRDEGRRQRFAQRSGLPTYADWRQLVAAEKPDIVSVATYTPVHAEMTIACAEAGAKAIFCEKPVAPTLAEAEAMLAACQKAGALLTFNHNRRFNHNNRKLAAHIAAGGLGQLTSGSLQWGSGRLGNVGTHMIDALCMLSGRRVEAVSGTLDLAGKPDCRGQSFSDPGGWGVLRLEGGLMVTLDAADWGRTPGSVVLNGELGRANADGSSVALEYWDGRQENWSAGPRGQSMDTAVEEIVATLDGAPFPYAAADAVHTLEAIIAFHASHRRQAQWTELPLQGADREMVLNSG